MASRTDSPCAAAAAVAVCVSAKDAEALSHADSSTPVEAFRYAPPFSPPGCSAQSAFLCEKSAVSDSFLFFLLSPAYLQQPRLLLYEAQRKDA